MLKTASKQYKFVLVGDSAVGKSSLLNRFVDKSFSQSLLSTIGVDFKFKKIRLQNQDIKLQIWDTAGQQTFRSIVSAYYSSADAIVIVYDITSYESFENIKSYWIEEAENNNKNNAKIFLIGNKIDEQSRRQVQKFALDTFVDEHNIDGVFQASAKTGQTVQESFTQIARSLYLGIKAKNNTNKQTTINIKSSQNDRQSRRSVHQNIKQQNRQQIKHQPDEYQQIVSVDEDGRRDLGRNNDNTKEQKGKINLQSSNKPKNPNYNKSCCLK